MSADCERRKIILTGHECSDIMTCIRSQVKHLEGRIFAGDEHLKESLAYFKDLYDVVDSQYNGNKRG